MQTTAEKIDAVERLCLVQNDALRVLIEHVRALTVVNGALLEQLSGQIDRDVIREAALAALDAHGHVPGGLAGTLVEALTRDPTDRQDVAGSTLASLSARLQ
ncbi:hypothetical protein [Methylobacterium sp. 391_Methyba4]|uniref:hypothetical protein n=1 Tax=Methylobacterium sp. 391_Methyba4 TaxID=3038924 RepID=UPI002420215E|nr:hypothetical protein [Methylobacterium sp. 391_Methyba4]WFS07619.1 hypothetical protein P9K36_30440 [Methylobacterium sp. 391_Methyba4]